MKRTTPPPGVKRLLDACAGVGMRVEGLTRASVERFAASIDKSLDVLAQRVEEALPPAGSRPAILRPRRTRRDGK